MIFLRAVQKRDLDDIIALSKKASLGFTTFPKDPKALEKKLLKSISSFQKEVEHPNDEFYLFALEDTVLHKVIGVSAIFATTGGGEPLYFFQKEDLAAQSSLPHVPKTIPILSPISYIRGPSELCSLFLHPDARAHGLGRLLSLGRFLFVAKFQERFTDSFFAELRGVIENERSPFWDGVGRHFLDITLHDALDLLCNHGRGFIPQFLPKYPIYIPLLPKEVQEVIGKTHRHTEAALMLLIHQGFTITDEIDLFDGGPKLRAMKNEIRVVTESREFLVVDIVESIDPKEKVYLLSNDNINFRACIGPVKIHDNQEITILKEAAQALLIDIGNTIRCVQL